MLNHIFQTLPLDSKFSDVDLDTIASAWQYDNELASAIIWGFDRGQIIFNDKFHEEEVAAWRQSKMLSPNLVKALE